MVESVMMIICSLVPNFLMGIIAGAIVLVSTTSILSLCNVTKIITSVVLSYFYEKLTTIKVLIRLTHSYVIVSNHIN